MHGYPSKPGAERALIAALAARAGHSRALRTPIGDDCAILRLQPADELAVTTDLLLEHTHFRRDWHSPESAGHRCLARGLSDLAATGAKPLAAFLSLAIPLELRSRWLTRFLQGMLTLAARYKLPLAGGDTAEAPRSGDAAALFSADIVLLGTVPRGTALLRSGARSGDILYVTGSLGGAAAQLRTLAARKPSRSPLRHDTPGNPQLFPQPRVPQGLRLRTLATAAIDLSDGLSTDLEHLCQASKVAAEIDARLIPVHPLAVAGAPAGILPTDALHGGEDYELLFTARPGTPIPRRIAGVPLTAIGRIRKREPGAPNVTLLRDGQRSELAANGWEHFRSGRVRPGKQKH